MSGLMRVRESVFEPTSFDRSKTDDILRLSGATKPHPYPYWKMAIRVADLFGVSRQFCLGIVDGARGRLDDKFAYADVEKLEVGSINNYNAGFRLGWDYRDARRQKSA